MTSSTKKTSEADSQELKIATLSYLLFRRNFLGAFTESFNQADVLGITRGNMHTWEFEIKVSKEDLAKELKAIRFITGADTNMRRARAANKIHKHISYIKERVPSPKKFIPNFFSFVVPESIAEYAKRGVEGTPYGVYLVNAAGLYSVITPEKIHKGFLSLDDLFLLVRKASTESLGLREKLKHLTI